MTLSNSTDFNQTRNEIISDALVTLGVYQPGDTISTNDINICSNWLNKIVKSWQAQGINIWARLEGTLFLRYGINTYVLSATSSDKGGQSTIFTTLSTAAASSATALVVVDTTGMTAGDNIGIELDDNTRQWTTIVSVNSSTSLTITAALTGASASGNTVFTYTTAIGRPITISNARFRTSDGTEIPIEIKGRDEFMLIPQKSNLSNTTNQLCFTTQDSQATLYIWPGPNLVNTCINFSYTRMIDDFDSSSDNADMPVECLVALTSNLMYAVSGVYQLPITHRQLLKQDAAESFLQMRLNNTDGGSIRVVPNYRYDE